MPWFRCLVRGENFVTPDGKVMGFYTARWVNSKDANSAEMECLERLRTGEELKKVFDRTKSGTAKVYFEEIEEVSERPRSEGKGFTFFEMSGADGNGQHEAARSLEKKVT